MTPIITIIVLAVLLVGHAIWRSERDRRKKLKQQPMLPYGKRKPTTETYGGSPRRTHGV